MTHHSVTLTCSTTENQQQCATGDDQQPVSRSVRWDEPRGQSNLGRHADAICQQRQELHHQDGQRRDRRSPGEGSRHRRVRCRGETGGRLHSSGLIFTLNFPFYQLPTTSLFFLQGMDVSLFKDAYEGPKFDFLLSHAAYCRDVLKLKKGQKAVISNGRVSHNLVSYCLKHWKCTSWTNAPFYHSYCSNSINTSVSYLQIIGPLEEEEVFNQDDFLLLESIILKTSGERIKSKVQQFGTEEDRYFISHHCICRFSQG